MLISETELRKLVRMELNEAPLDFGRRALGMDPIDLTPEEVDAKFDRFVMPAYQKLADESDVYASDVEVMASRLEKFRNDMLTDVDLLANVDPNDDDAVQKAFAQRELEIIAPKPAKPTRGGRSSKEPNADSLTYRGDKEAAHRTYKLKTWIDVRAAEKVDSRFKLRHGNSDTILTPEEVNAFYDFYFSEDTDDETRAAFEELSEKVLDGELSHYDAFKTLLRWMKGGVPSAAQHINMAADQASEEEKNRDDTTVDATTRTFDDNTRVDIRESTERLWSLENKSGRNLDNLTKYVEEFMPFSQERLGFDQSVSIEFISDSTNADQVLGKTAYYDPANMQVSVFVDRRHEKDILRSLSHELVHHAQNCKGELDNLETHEGYASTDDGERIERDAYERGSLNLRNWEDSLKLEETYHRRNYKMKLTRTELNELIKEKVEQRVSAANEVDDIEEADELSAGLAAAERHTKRLDTGSVEGIFKSIAGTLANLTAEKQAEYVVKVLLPKIGLSGEDVVKMVSHIRKKAADAEATPVGQPTPQEVADADELIGGELDERTKTTDTAYGRDDGGRRTKKPSGELNEEEEEVEEGYDAWDRDDDDVSEELTLKEWKNNELNRLLNSKFKIGN